MKVTLEMPTERLPAQEHTDQLLQVLGEIVSNLSGLEQSCVRNLISYRHLLVLQSQERKHFLLTKNISFPSSK